MFLAATFDWVKYPVGEGSFSLESDRAKVGIRRGGGGLQVQVLFFWQVFILGLFFVLLFLFPFFFLGVLGKSKKWSYPFFVLWT